VELGERSPRLHAQLLDHHETIELDERTATEYATKYDYRPSPDSPDEAWFSVRPRVVFARDRDYPRTATRFSFD
jgi:hypothetical protein